MPNLGPDFDLAQRLARLEAAIAGIQANPLGTSFSQSQSDGSIGFQLAQDPDSGGTALSVRHGPNSPFSDTTSTPGTPQHPRFLYIGQLDPAKLPVNAIVDTDAGFVLLRDDGSPSIIVTESGGVQVFDPNGALVLATDETNGGLATSLSYPTPQPVTPSNGNSINTVGFTLVHQSTFINLHTRLVFDTVGNSNTGGGGTFNVAVENGATFEVISGPGYSVPSGLAGISAHDELVVPASWVGQQVVAFCQATGGSGGPTYVNVQNVYGIGSTTSVSSFSSQFDL